jgi:hypothetical protein
MQDRWREIQARCQTTSDARAAFLPITKKANKLNQVNHQNPAKDGFMPYYDVTET